MTVDIKKEMEEDILCNIQFGIVEQARKDYIKGAKVLISIFKEPMEKLLYNTKAKDMILKARPGHKIAAVRHIYWYKDAKRFVEQDPYEMFNNNQEMIFKAWNQMAMEEYLEDTKEEKEHEGKANKTGKTNTKLHEKKKKDSVR